MRTFVLALLALTLVGAGAGCGSDDAEEADVTPAAAAAEIDTIKSMLDDALAKYEDGDAEAAEELVGDAYLEHFEEVEHPLEEVDEELMEDLEHTISTEIREKLKAGAPAAEVAQLIAATKADLDRAKAALQG
jgi:predicted lipid-binding transport protein (Tim44 family)